MGQGYVGLPVSLRAVEVGFDVVGFDVDHDRVEALAVGRSFIDDVSDDDLARILATGRFHPTSDTADLADFDVAVVSVPTPLRDGAPDLGYIESAAAMLAPHVRPGSCVVLESTTYPGTTQDVFVPLLERGSGLTAGADFAVGYSPERIDPSNPTWHFRNTPKIVSGIDEASLDAVDALLLGDRRHHRAASAASARPSWPSCSRTRSATSTSRSSTSWRCTPTSSASTCGTSSTPPPPSRSGSCGSRPAPASAGTACRSIRRTCRGRCARRSGGRSGSSSWPTTSTSTCPTTWSRG